MEESVSTPSLFVLCLLFTDPHPNQIFFVQIKIENKIKIKIKIKVKIKIRIKIQLQLKKEEKYINEHITDRILN